MRLHRWLGLALVTFGLAVLFGQMAVLYGVVGKTSWMITIGLPGAAILDAVGAVCFAAGFLLAAAPRATVHHVRRLAGAGRWAR